MRTRPRVRVVFPAAESPTTPRMVGRGTAAALLVGRFRVGIGLAVPEEAALEDVLRLDRQELVTLQRAIRLEQPASLAEARPVERVADAASVGEAGSPPPALDVLVKHPP